jgi:AraC family transcriptional regulator, regulatory protein of adaptative response / methylated-DNA-[protein]-cysteine methyltransferase
MELHQGGFMSNRNIVYCNLDSPLGEMIAGATDDGICFLEWHDRGGISRILKRVEKRYRLPVEAGEHQNLDLLKDELYRYFTGALKEFSVPLNIQGTSFECRTWDLLLRIPYGETRSYGDLARDLNKPGAVRAVGRANGANYISIIIPCHRVIAASGNLQGYGGGLWRKKWLLELEAGKPHELSPEQQALKL